MCASVCDTCPWSRTISKPADVGIHVSSGCFLSTLHSTGDLCCRETSSLKLAKLRGCTFVNQYVVIKYLGRGACGRVFLCMDMTDNRLYAVKVSPAPHHGHHQTGLARIRCQLGRHRCLYQLVLGTSDWICLLCAFTPICIVGGDKVSQQPADSLLQGSCMHQVCLLHQVALSAGSLMRLSTVCQTCWSCGRNTEHVPRSRKLMTASCPEEGRVGGTEG